MSWEEIQPMRPIRTRNEEAVTVSFRRSGSSPNPALTLICTKALTERLGWPKGSRLLAQRDRVNGLIRLQPVEKGGFGCVHVKGFITQKFHLDDVKGEIRKAEDTPFRIEGDALIITLPDWAAPQRKGVAAAVQARDQAVARTTAAPSPARPVVPPPPPRAPARAIAPPPAPNPPPPPVTQRPATPDRPRHVSIMERVPDQGIGRRNG